MVRGANGPEAPVRAVQDGDCPTQLPNLPDHPTGPGILIKGSSSTYGAPLALLCPQNGEWTPTSTGPCNGSRTEDYCGRGGNSGEFGGCCGGTCHIIGGCSTTCVRTGYGADPTACCLSPAGTKTIGNKTCDPRYRNPLSIDCTAALAAHCDNSTNFFTSTCKTWLKNVNSAVKDELALKYCANSTDPFCACYTAKVPVEWENDTIKKAIFRCLDKDCEGGSNPNALKPYGLVCPTTYVDCQQNDIRLKLVESGIDSATVANNCGNIDLGTSAPPGPTVPTTTTPATGGVLALTKNMLYGLLILLLLIIVFLVITTGKKGVKTGGARR